MEAETWKSRVRARVTSAKESGDHVPALLASLQAKIASPVPAGDAAAGRAWVLATADEFEQASGHLVSAMIQMGAARELALRGGGLSPAEPLDSIDDLADEDLPERNALTKLRGARDHAATAYARVEWCRSHLWAAKILLDHPRLPNVGGLIEEERLAAVRDLVQAKNQVDQLSTLTDGAVQDVSGAN